MRLIEGDELFGELCDHLEEDEDTERAWADIEAIVQAFNHAPTVNPWEVVYEGLAQIPLFCGTYDAKNGSKEFMHGVSTVMESIAMKAGKQEEFDEMFLKNILKSKRKEE